MRSLQVVEISILNKKDPQRLCARSPMNIGERNSPSLLEILGVKRFSKYLVCLRNEKQNIY